MNKRAQFGVILPAAGSGTRFGGGDKLLVELAGGKTVLQRSVELFGRRPEVMAILLVTAPERFGGYRAHVQAFAQGKSLEMVAGGRERWESVLFGLRHLAAMGGAEYVAVHDAARPLCPAAVIDEAFRVAVERGAALPCLGEPATLKRRGSDGCVSDTIDRRGLFQAQTPQCFALPKLLEGYEMLLAAGRLADVTDDAQVFERMGWVVPITTGAASNLKITTAEDVALARALVRLEGGVKEG